MGGKHGKNAATGNAAYDANYAGTTTGKHGRKNKHNDGHTTQTVVTQHPSGYGYTETRTDVYSDQSNNAKKHRVTESEQIHIANRDQMHPELVTMVPVGPMGNLRVAEDRTKVVTTETTYVQPPPQVTQTTHVQETTRNAQTAYGQHGYDATTYNPNINPVHPVGTVTDPTYPVNPVVNPNFPVNPSTAGIYHAGPTNANNQPGNYPPTY